MTAARLALGVAALTLALWAYASLLDAVATIAGHLAAGG